MNGFEKMLSIAVMATLLLIAIFTSASLVGIEREKTKQMIIESGVCPWEVAK